MTAEIKLLSAFKNFETVIDFDPGQGSVDFDLLKIINKVLLLRLFPFLKVQLN